MNAEYNLYVSDFGTAGLIWSSDLALRLSRFSDCLKHVLNPRPAGQIQTLTKHMCVKQSGSRDIQLLCNSLVNIANVAKRGRSFSDSVLRCAKFWGRENLRSLKTFIISLVTLVKRLGFHTYN